MLLHKNFHYFLNTACISFKREESAKRMGSLPLKATKGVVVSPLLPSPHKFPPRPTPVKCRSGLGVFRRVLFFLIFFSNAVTQGCFRFTKCFCIFVISQMASHKNLSHVSVVNLHTHWMDRYSFCEKSFTFTECIGKGVMIAFPDFVKTGET